MTAQTATETAQSEAEARGAAVARPEGQTTLCAALQRHLDAGKVVCYDPREGLVPYRDTTTRGELIVFVHKMTRQEGGGCMVAAYPKRGAYRVKDGDQFIDHDAAVGSGPELIAFAEEAKAREYMRDVIRRKPDWRKRLSVVFVPDFEWV